jgi:hypothetical protein
MRHYHVADHYLLNRDVPALCDNHMTGSEARRPAAKNIRRRHFTSENTAGNRCHIAQVGHAGVVVRKHGAGELVDFGQPGGAPAKRGEGD